eukprot:CAMPEP_0184497410 /NCGR_PEP_ID=MMETSP0113_2-20130426/36460_1 /TAXON_ID=91329 /ORGANISM="Norrisiella sphaerica, Strain BC52" /LENGTH=609 /DNA_ID=CAMNT_0026884503 /DNA_START=43 /DNA_END=1872 /DNA_ORIENTATION=-
MPRKKPASGKQRRQQMKEKRARKATEQARQRSRSRSKSAGEGEEREREGKSERQPRLVTSFGGRIGGTDSKLLTHFVREPDEVVQLRREAGDKPLTPAPTYHSNSPPEADPTLSMYNAVLSHPVRPKWRPSESKETLEAREENQFREWATRIQRAMASGARMNERRRKDDDKSDKKYETGRCLELGSLSVTPYELNIEVWRQLWRVIEFSDVLIVVTDVRYPTFHLPPSLIASLTKDMGKGVVVVLNKSDLVSEDLVRAWRNHLENIYPTIAIAEFSTKPYEDADHRGKGGVNARKKRLKRRVRRDLMTKHIEAHVKGVLDAAKSVLPSPGAAAASDYFAGSTGKLPAREKKRGKEKQGVCLGLIGHPNVGKTSLLNALVGRKVASTSRTAGHTKHLQHIPLEKYRAYLPDVYVIDCPGLVFPRAVPRHLTELMGLYPIAQIRETVSAVRFLAEHVNVQAMYALQKPEWYEKEDAWTPQMICEAYAEKKGYLLGRGGAPDTHRAGLEIVRDCVDGALLLAFAPPFESRKRLERALLHRHVVTAYGAGSIHAIESWREKDSGDSDGGMGLLTSHRTRPGSNKHTPGVVVVALNWGARAYFDGVSQISIVR